MAEGTRFRSLEEQVKKQEIKLQELVESLHTSQSEQQQIKKELKQELEESSKRMEGLLSGMEQNFLKILEQKLNNLLLRTPMKEKTTEGDGRVPVDHTPLLPTPPAHHRIQTEGEAQKLLKRTGVSFESQILLKLTYSYFLENILGIG